MILSIVMAVVLWACVLFLIVDREFPTWVRVASFIVYTIAWSALTYGGIL